MATSSFAGVTPRDPVVVGGPLAAVVAGHVVLPRVRPNVGWSAFLAVMLLTGVAVFLTSGDARSEAGTARAANDMTGTAVSHPSNDGHLSARSGYPSLFALSTAALGLLYILALGAWTVLA